MKPVQKLLLLLLLLPGFLYAHTERSIVLSSNQIATDPTSIQRLRTNVYLLNDDNSKVLIDGTFNEFGEQYSNALDGMDARKLFNSGFNISILRGTTNLIIERRHSIETMDSIPFKIWGVQKRQYLFEFISNTFDPDLSCFLEDRYLHTSTPIHFNDTTKIIFTINNDAASSSSDRFKIMFKKEPPVSFTFLRGQRQNDQIELLWQTQNEFYVKEYIVEKSTDGQNFSSKATFTATQLSTNNYQWIDYSAYSEINYYRIKTVEADGKIGYQGAVFAPIEKNITGISIFPNPASISNLNLQMLNQKEGTYQVWLMNSFGQCVFSKTIQFSGISSIISISPNRLIAKGIYCLLIKKPDGATELFKVVF